MAKSDYQIAVEQRERYEYLRSNGHLDYLEKAKRCDSFFKGEQWDEETKARLDATRRPALTINKILPNVASIAGEQIAAQAIVQYRPLKSGTQEVANALNKVYLQIAQNNGLKWLRNEVFMDGAITSRGFYQVTVEFSDSLFGEVYIDVLNPKNVLIDPDSEEYDPVKWKEWFYSKWISLDDVERLYGKEARKELAGRQGSSSYLGYDFIDDRPDTFGGEDRRVADDDADHRRRLRLLRREYKQWRMVDHFVDLRTGDLRQIPEGMGREKIQTILQEFNVAVIKRPAEFIQMVDTIDDVVLFNEPGPYKHFTVVPYFPFFRKGATLGLVENQIGPQELYNKTVSQELHVINTTANSGYKVKTGSLKNMTLQDLEERGAETGLVVELADINDLDKIQPNQIPSGLDRLAYKAAEDLKEASMVSDYLRGFAREDVAAKALKANQAMSRGNFAMPLENLARTDHILAARILDLVQTYYTEERVIHITGDRLGAQDETITINQVTPEGSVVNDLTLGEYSVVAIPVPWKESFEQSQFEEAARLREIGVPIPDTVLVENSSLANRQEIVAEMRQSQAPEAQQLQQQVAQLEIQIKQLEAQKMGAEKQKIESEAVLNLVRAQQAAEEDPNAKNGSDPNLEMQRLQGEMQIKVQELELRRYEIEQQLQLKREELGMKMQLQREQAQVDMSLKQQESQQRMALDAQSTQAQIESNHTVQMDRNERQAKVAEAKAKSQPKAKPTEKKT